TFVCIEAEDPFILSTLCCELLLLGKARPWIFDDARAALCGDFARLIDRAGIDYHNFIRPGDGFASRANVPGFVEGDDGGGDFQDRNKRSEVRSQKERHEDRGVNRSASTCW